VKKVEQSGRYPEKVMILLMGMILIHGWKLSNPSEAGWRVIELNGFMGTARISP
jgi:hypothetical protein